MNRNAFRLLLPVLLLAAALPAAAQTRPASMPDWNHLSPAQRELLIAPLRQRWDANPRERGRMWDHAQRWRSMTPAQRAQARRGMDRWQGMSPQEREQARMAFERLRDLPPERRQAMRDKLRRMTPEQRKAWLESQANPR